jgi:predicted transcriptional regulator
MSTSVLLSIKPMFADRIFTGEKRYEFRKALFRDRSVQRILVYASAPISKVIGEFSVEGFLELEPELLWQKTREYAGISKEFFDSYFAGRSKGYAIRVGEVMRYPIPLELDHHFNVKQAPQSFIYIPRA